MSSTIEITKICEHCGKSFIARKCTTRYCCKRCAEHAYKAAKRKEHVVTQQRKADRKEAADLSEKEYLTPTECAKLLGICRASVYNYLADNSIPCQQFKGKTLIRRYEIEKLFNGEKTYVKRPAPIQDRPITEFYTSKEVQEKYGISNSGMYKIAKQEGWPSTMNRGKTLWSQKHVDAHFAKKAPDPEITEWYTLAEIKEKFGMTDSAVWNFTSKEAIPKKKEGKITLYSRTHVDIAKGVAGAAEEESMTIAEAMEKYQMTRDQLYHYLKTYGIPKIKEGRIVKVSRKHLEKLFAPPQI